MKKPAKKPVRTPRGKKAAASSRHEAPAIVYQDYPKWLRHPHEVKGSEGKPDRFAPVLVNNEDQEEEYRAKGYRPPGTPDPFSFILAKATEKVDQAILGMNEEMADRTRSMSTMLTKQVEGQTKRLAISVAKDIDEIFDEIGDLADRVTAMERALPPAKRRKLARLKAALAALRAST